MEIRELPIRQVRKDGGTQLRVGLNPAKVAEYAEAMAGGAVFPPLSAYEDADGVIWLWDGFHRLAAAWTIKASTVRVEVESGSLRDAILKAAGANATHGLPRSDEDKRHVVDTLLADPEWRNRSDRWLAEASRTSHPFVAGRRAATGHFKGQRTGRDGVTRGLPGADVAEEIDPWGGRTGREARGWLESLASLDQVEALIPRAPSASLAKAAATLAQDMRVLSAPGADLMGWVKSHGWLKASKGLRRYVVRILDGRAEGEPLNAEQTEHRLLYLCQFEELEALAASALRPEVDRHRLLKLVSTYIPPVLPTTARGLRAAARGMRKDLPGLADALSARADAIQEEEDARHHAHAERVTDRRDLAREAWCALAGTDEAAAAACMESLSPEVSQLLMRVTTNLNEDEDERRRVATRIREVEAKRGLTVNECPDPRCEGWAWFSEYGACWRCFNTPHTVQRQLDAMAKQVGPLLLAGWRPEGVQVAVSRPVEALDVGAELETVEPPLQAADVETPSGELETFPVGCPCCGAHVTLQTTIDRGEVLPEHDTPLGRECPAVFLRPAEAGALAKLQADTEHSGTCPLCEHDITTTDTPDRGVLIDEHRAGAVRCPASWQSPYQAASLKRELLSNAPLVVHLLKQLYRASGSATWPEADIHAAAPEYVEAYAQWFATGAPGTPKRPAAGAKVA